MDREPGPHNTPPELFTADEVARAAGVPASRVLHLLTSGAVRAVPGPEGSGGVRPADAFIAFDDAVAAVRTLRQNRPYPELFSAATARTPRAAGLTMAVSGTLHAGMVACVVLVTGFGLAPEAATLGDLTQDAPAHLVFLALPGPGGGGGGGGLRRPTPPPRAEREGFHAVSSPIPARPEPRPIDAPEDLPPLESEPLPPVIAPIVVLGRDDRNRAGTLDGSAASADSRGPGEGGGVGSGAGSGVGEGSGPGIGPGSGGGTGGGPYRPGSGVTPPRLLREVKPDYTEDGRRKGTTGEVVLEIVVRRDGTVGEIQLRRGLPDGLNDRAIEAVRQWRFTPARRLGEPVDVVVEVVVEFKLR